MEFKLFDLGLVDFKQAWQTQKDLFLQVKTGAIESALVVCRHYPVITLGRRSKRENILAPDSELALKGIQVCEIERGGEVTYHGPGQLVAYPVFNLSLLKKDIHWFLRQLEEIVINFLSGFGINCQRRAGFTGVWLGNQKICSIGIAIRNWIAFHGLSINIKKGDLGNFKLIRPCGIDVEMTSLETLLGREIRIEDAQESLLHSFRDIFIPTEPVGISLNAPGGAYLCSRR